MPADGTRDREVWPDLDRLAAEAFVNLKHRTLDRREVVGYAPLGFANTWTPDEAQVFIDQATGSAYVKVRGFVYSDKLGDEVKTIPVTVPTKVTVPLTVSTPGARIWWKPWRRRPDAQHHFKPTVPVTVHTQVDVTRTAWAKLPEMPKYPTEYGRPLRMVEYDARPSYRMPGT